MAEIVEYYLVSSYSEDDLNRRVNERIKDGWQPFGTPTIYADCEEYFQAVVKYKKDLIKKE